MSKKVKVTSIQIQYPDGKTKELSIGDARELYKQLDDLFGKTYVPPAMPIVIERERWPRWSTPTYIDAKPTYTFDSQPRPSTPQIWCCAD